MEINENIYRLTIPYKDIFTTVYLVKTDKGALLFDAGSYDEDLTAHTKPFLDALGITAQELKYVFISHNHTDHAGGLAAIMQVYPQACILSACPRLKEAYKAYNFVAPSDGDSVLDVLRVVTIPGHTVDSCGLLDLRTNTLISGDSLQLYGIFGSGKWGSNISMICAHKDAVDKLRGMKIAQILTAHDYHPYGYHYEGETVLKALDACINPFYEMKNMILQNPDADDAQICAKYNASGIPTVGEHVIAAVRKELL